MKKSKLVVIHPAIAPYRIDFFNSINNCFDTSFYFEFGDAIEQSFNQDMMKQRLSFIPKYLKPGFKGIKNLRLDVFKILKKEKPDIVCCSEYNILSFIVLACKFLFNWKMKIYTICDDSLDIARQCHGIRKLMRSMLLYMFTGVILADKKALDWYQKNLRHSAKLIYFPIIQNDYVFRQSLEQALPLSRENNTVYALEDKTVLLYVGRLVEVKNVFFLLDVYKEIRNKHNDTILVIVGEGSLKDNLINYAKEQNLSDHIIFTGKQEGQTLMSWYNIGDIFILPSTFEPFGTVVNEALLSGCYTFCSVAAGASSLINEPDNGLLFNPEDTQDLVFKINDFLHKSTTHNRLAIKQNLMSVSYDEQFDLFLSSLNYKIA